MTLVNTAPREAGRMYGCRGENKISFGSFSTIHLKKWFSLGWKTVWDAFVAFRVRWCAVGQSSSNYSPTSSSPWPNDERWSFQWRWLLRPLGPLSVPFRSETPKITQNFEPERRWCLFVAVEFWAGAVLWRSVELFQVDCLQVGL